MSATWRDQATHETSERLCAKEDGVKVDDRAKSILVCDERLVML